MTQPEIDALRKVIVSADGGCRSCVNQCIAAWNHAKPEGAPTLRLNRKAFDAALDSDDDERWLAIEVEP